MKKSTGSIVQKNFKISPIVVSYKTFALVTGADL